VLFCQAFIFTPDFKFVSKKYFSAVHIVSQTIEFIHPKGKYFYENEKKEERRGKNAGVQ
jgi:hypothetical protein